MIVRNVPRSEIEVLCFSIVVYRPNLAEFESTLTSLGLACEALLRGRPNLSISLFLVDNGGLPDVQPKLEELHTSGISTTILAGHGNIGYGRGHNLAIEQSSSQYHLILNPDIDLDPAALVRAIDFLEANPSAGLLTPWIGDDQGNQQFLCRRYPTVLDLFARGFLPRSLRQLFARRLARYEMRDLIDDRNVVWDPPIVSGCFMLFRTEVLKTLAGFDPRYFLYFEDYDLSLRAHDVARVVYVPTVRVLHHGGGAARKGSTHIKMFARSAYQFFSRFGWKWL
jgi:GT2 family glycosyltransferase